MSHNCHSGVLSIRDTYGITSSSMLELVYGVLVVLQSLICCSAAFENRSTMDSETYNHSHQHLYQSQENQRFTISQVDKTEVPSFIVSPQYSCVGNSSYPCPSWTYCDDKEGLCRCPHITSGALSCNGFDNINVHVLDCNCVTYDEEQNQTEVGYCYFNCILTHLNPETLYLELPSNTSDWNDLMCGNFNRAGMLCGKCKDGFYLRTYSFDISCMNCTYFKSNWWKYMLHAYLPLTIFYFIILFFEINIHSSPLQGYVIYSQAVLCPPIARILYSSMHKLTTLNNLVKFVGSLYGVWNLDFFRMYNSGICLQIDTLVSLSLELAVAIYPLFLIIATYMLITLYDHKFRPLVVLWSPFRALLHLFQSNWDIRTSTVDVFATIFFLTYAKILNSCFDLLIPMRVYHFSKPEHQVNYTWRLYYDATIPYFGTAHTPFAILAIVVLLVFVLIPALVILVYPFKVCRRCFNVLPSRCQILLHTFMDSYQGCYKDGTEVGTQDCRWFLSLLFLLRFSLWGIYACTLNEMFFAYTTMILVFIAMVTIVIDPYKSHLGHYTLYMFIFILLIAAIYASSLGAIFSIYKNDVDLFYLLISLFAVILVLPLLYIFGIILLWLFNHRKFCLNLMRQIRAWRLGYYKLI